ncbi:hypothetical protein BGW36DRAFT_367181 [Talaromyces proteolyticus]|uniref:Xylanolytic transcriptional activator regulatory domain-containing protein n=1 Tax=Talaromyces proteolyticus TaxID=1131652 RepID=A0AAD4L3H5_9EURO|nr:uncharacterized protein BGW36DRAFT_367181 [Talaromyces proteolyticus]KAH8705247.1 hypothetical protein BGW36DRAFT_367181 [Talaromyces proteolyticus]
MGKPKRAWLATRKAINHALLLGLHRPNQSNNRIKQPLWSQVWQMDRQLSSILGVPYSVPYSQSRHCIDESIPAQIMHRINNVVCHIGDRNQGIGQHSIPEIETQIQECATLFPEEWFSLSTEGLSFEFIYARQVCLMYLMQLKKNLYLPDVLTALQNPEASQTHREHAVQACREMVSAYKVLRNSSKSALVICDLMDFIVFSAALVLALHLLAPPGSRNSSRDADDWAIITHLTLTFRQLSRAIECSVAKQAATLLEYLYAAHHHQYAGPEEYVAVIPWFGRVKISCVPRQQHIAYLQTPSTDDNAESVGSCIEFGVNLLTPTTGSGNELESWSIQHMEEELGIDWTAFDDADWEYDWHQIFYSTNHYESTD